MDVLLFLRAGAQLLPTVLSAGTAATTRLGLLSSEAMRRTWHQIAEGNYTDWPAVLYDWQLAELS